MASNTELQLDWLILCKNKENWDNTGKYRCDPLSPFIIILLKFYYMCLILMIGVVLIICKH